MVKLYRVNGYNNVKLVEPRVIKFSFDNEEKYFTLGKGAINYIAEELSVSMQVLEKVYSISKDIWLELIDLLISRSDNFSFDSLSYYAVEGLNTVIDISDNNLDSELFEFYNKIEKHEVFDIINSWNNISYLIYNDSKTGGVAIDIDINSPEYRMYDFSVLGNKILETSSPVLCKYSLKDFLISSGIDNEISLSEKLSDSMLNMYKEDEAKLMVLSLREVLDIIRDSKAVVNTRDDGLVSNIEGIADSETVTDFFNSFEIPFKTLKKMTYLRKSLKYKNITVDKMLDILSLSYKMKDNNICANSIASLLSLYFSNESDKNTVISEIN